jgi:DNA-binding response OmpR family regulator
MLEGSMPMTKRALIVEDEEMIVVVLEDVLEDLGYEVAIASSVAEATQLATTGEFRLALIDLNVQGGDSRPVGKILEARGIPYAYTSGADRRDEGLEGQAFLTKPYSFEALTAMIRQLDPGDTSPS